MGLCYSLGVNCLLFLLLTVQTVRFRRARKRASERAEHIKGLSALVDDMLEKGYK